MPDTLLLYTVEAADTGFGVGLVPAVESAVRTLTGEIAGLLRRAADGPSVDDEHRAARPVDQRLADRA